MTHEIPDNPVARLFALEPAVIRGGLIAVTSVVTVVTGRVIDTVWISDILFIYSAVSPIIAGLLIRGAVTPVQRVQDIIQRVREETTQFNVENPAQVEDYPEEK